MGYASHLIFNLMDSQKKRDLSKIKGEKNFLLLLLFLFQWRKRKLHFE